MKAACAKQPDGDVGFHLGSKRCAAGHTVVGVSAVEHYWNYFAAARARRAELQANMDHVHAVLREGALRARAVAEVVLARARKASGLR